MPRNFVTTKASWYLAIIKCTQPRCETSAMPQSFTLSAEITASSQLHALLNHAALRRSDDVGWIRITGADRVRWLNGMITNSVLDLQPGEGRYTFFLNALGRIQGDGIVFSEPDALLLKTSKAQLEKLISHIEHFIIMDDVELHDISDIWSGLLIAGPDAHQVLASAGIPASSTSEITRIPFEMDENPAALLHVYSPLVPRFEVWSTPKVIDLITERLCSAGASLCSPVTLEQLRTLEGTPLYGVDIRDRELPQETGQDRALHFSKGCYLGQEIVERIRSRGNVHRTFHAFQLNGTLPATGSPLEAEGKVVGELTTVTSIPQLYDLPPLQLALGYIRREALDRHTPITYTSGTAVPVPSPFTQVEASEPLTASEK